MTGHPRVVAVVPAYNEAGTIRDVIARLVPHADAVVVVDDGSADGTADRLDGLGVHVLRHLVNRGQGAALQTGITYALRLGADIVVTFDADGQHDPEEIAALAAPVARGECDVVLGSRFIGRTVGMPWRRRLLLKGAIVFTRLTAGLRVTDAHNGLRALSAGAAAALDITMDRMAHASEILERVRAHGWRYQEVPVTVRYTAYSMAKGQQGSEAIRIAAQVLAGKLR